MEKARHIQDDINENEQRILGLFYSRGNETEIAHDRRSIVLDNAIITNAIPKSV